MRAPFRLTYCMIGAGRLLCVVAELVVVVVVGAVVLRALVVVDPTLAKLSPETLNPQHPSSEL